jgi:hypothetical protein
MLGLYAGGTQIWLRPYALKKTGHEKKNRHSKQSEKRWSRFDESLTNNTFVCRKDSGQ